MADLSVRPAGTHMSFGRETMAARLAVATAAGMTVVEWAAIRNINNELASRLRFRRNQREIGDAEWEHIKATYRPVRLAPQIAPRGYSGGDR